MEKISLLGQEFEIKHRKGTLFDRTFAVYTKDRQTQIETAFPLTDYDVTFRIKQSSDGAVLYSKTNNDAELVVSGETFHLTDNINLGKTGKLFFEVKIQDVSDEEKVYIPMYGFFINEK